MTGNPKPTRPIAPETGREMHYHVTDGTFEIASDGTVLFTGYEDVHGQARVRFYATVTPQVLARLARIALQAAADAHNLGEFQAFLDDSSDDIH